MQEKKYNLVEARNRALELYGGDAERADAYVAQLEQTMDCIWNMTPQQFDDFRAVYAMTEVSEQRPEVLECDVVRFQNNKEKWVAFVGLLDGRPYEIFTGLQDDEEGILLPKAVTRGRIIKATNSDGTHRYDFQFSNKRGYKTTVEGLSEKFNKEYWNYAKLISGILRYRMPLDNVLKLVGSMQMESESINTWTAGVVRALKKYVSGAADAVTEQSSAEVQ